MARIEGVTQGGSLLARVVFWMSRRKLGRVIGPLRVHALHTRLLAGVGSMETAQEKASTVPATIKVLAEVLVAMRVGCPF
ncbi:MAG: hypothetical protein VCB80_07195 [Deltaproteobacteria bacterium]